MSIVQALKRRTARREQRLREAVYREHLAEGETPARAMEAAESAVRRRRRRRIAMFNAG